MNQFNNSTDICRYYVHATEQQLYGSGVNYATAVEFITEKNVFLIHTFFRSSLEWIVDEQSEWAVRFAEKYSKQPIELFTSDMIRNEQHAVYVTKRCTRRIYTPAMHKEFEKVMLSIGHKKSWYSGY